MTTLRDLADALLRQRAKASGGNGDPVTPEVIERVTLEKFDKTDVFTPGVDGLEPFETLVYENGTLIERRVKGE